MTENEIISATKQAQWQIERARESLGEIPLNSLQASVRQSYQILGTARKLLLQSMGEVDDTDDMGD